MGYESVERGAIVVDITSWSNGEGNLFVYVDQTAIKQSGNEDSQRLVSKPELETEFVTTIFKTGDRVSSYRVTVVPTATEDVIEELVI